MNKLWDAYYLEKWDRHTITIEDAAFACYSIVPGELYIVETYVIPERRRQGLATRLANILTDLAKTNGCRYLTTTVPLKQKDPEESIAAILSYGFKIYSASADSLAFIKDLEA